MQKISEDEISKPRTLTQEKKMASEKGLVLTAEQMALIMQDKRNSMRSKPAAACEATVNVKKARDRENKEHSGNKKEKKNEHETEEKREHKTTGKEKRAGSDTTNDMEDNGNKEDDWMRKRETTQYMKESKEQINEKGILLFKETKEVTRCKENIVEDKKPK